MQNNQQQRNTHTSLESLSAFGIRTHSQKQIFSYRCDRCDIYLMYLPVSSPLLHSHIQSDSFLCDCQLHWLPDWLVTRGLQAGVNATCAHPESLKGTSIFQAPSSSFVCGELCVCLICVYVGGCVEQGPH